MASRALLLVSIQAGGLGTPIVRISQEQVLKALVFYFFAYLLTIVSAAVARMHAALFLRHTINGRKPL